MSQGAAVADVGCGEGRAVLALANAYPRCTIHAIEPDEHSLRAMKQADSYEAVKVRINAVAGTSSVMDDAAYDVIFSIDVVHDTAAPADFLEDVRRALRPGGYYVMVEPPVDPAVIGRETRSAYAISCMYCTTVSLADDGAGYGIAMGPRKYEELARNAGFTRFRCTEHPGMFVLST